VIDDSTADRVFAASFDHDVDKFRRDERGIDERGDAQSVVDRAKRETGPSGHRFRRRH
jgi:hypothetical protein